MTRLHIPNIKLIALDMDGTLLRSDKSVRPDTIRDAIEYEDTDSYKITEMFINSREQILRRLLGTT